MTEKDTTDDTEKPSRDELAQRVEQLEQTVQQMLPSRRDALKLGGTALAAGALGSAATGSASAGTNSVGTIGSASSPVDAELEDINPGSTRAVEFNNNDITGVSSLSTDSLVIGGTLYELDGIIDVTGTSSTTYNLDTASDQVVVMEDEVMEDDGGGGFNELQVNGSTSGYEVIDTSNSKTSSLSQWPINSAYEREYIYLENRRNLEINMRINLIGGGTGLNARGEVGNPSGPISSVTFRDSGGNTRDMKALVLRRVI